MPDTDFDLGSSMEETYAELQSGGGSSEDSSGAATPAAADVSPPAQVSPPTGDAAPTSMPSAANPWDSMPKSWRKEMEAHWTAFNPDARKYIHEREKQALDGIMQYKATADQWGQTMEPFKQWFDHYNIDPRDAFKRLATSHIILKYGKPEDRAKWARQLVQDYGLAEVLGLQGGNPQGQMPVHQQSNEALFQMEQRLNAVQESLYNQKLQENMKTVESFFADPKNEFAADLQDDILKMFEQGRASTLQEAYEQAMWLNPGVRQKMMSREVENATKPKRPGPPNVKSSSVAPTPTESGDESIEETMRATLQRMKSR